MVGGQGGRAAVALSYQKMLLTVMGGHGADREGYISQKRLSEGNGHLGRSYRGHSSSVAGKLH